MMNYLYGRNHKPRMRRYTLRALARTVAVAAAAVASAAITVAPGANAASPPIWCSDTNTPVTYAGHTDTIYGRYCAPATGTDQVVLAVHGATYSHTYWTGIGGSPDTQIPLASAGQASLAIDRIGHGKSTHLPSLALTGTAEADILHQLIQDLRAGRIAHTRFKGVTLLGHSLGSGISVIEAAQHPHDADRLVLTGWGDLISPETVTSILATRFWPASIDPIVQHKVGVDPGALTTRPGQRQPLFAPRETAAVAQADEATKDWFGATELADTLITGLSPLQTHAIAIPTLVVDGSADGIFCRGLLRNPCSSSAALQNALAPAFQPTAHLTAAVIPGAGHCLQLDPDASTYIGDLVDWLHHRQ